jgi:hypothetical protein
MEERKEREIATFRFGVISNFVVSHELEHGERQKIHRQNSCGFRMFLESFTKIFKR